MDRYRPFIEATAEEPGVNQDILAFFGIEAGFDPLKRSPTGYSGIAQIGTDAVKDVREKTECGLKIQDDEMEEAGDWYDLRYHPLYGIANGVAYIGHLKAMFLQALLEKHKKGNKAWLLARLDQLEQKLGLPSRGNYQARYDRLLQHIL